MRTEVVGALPPDATAREELLRRERAAGVELVGAGVIVQMWRVPGRQANVGVYRVADATELHDVLTALPLWPYCRVEVEALASHPVWDTPA